MNANEENVQSNGSPCAAHFRNASGRLQEVDAVLRELYGTPRWASSGDPLDELIGTILSQHTSDGNTARAYASLRQRHPTWEEVLSAPTDDIADAIRSGGLANVKAARIQRVLQAIVDDLGQASLESLRTRPLDDARRWLRSLPGVGPKTAACVLLFSLGHPVMPVDTHVHRVSRRLGLISPRINADAAHAALDNLLGQDRDRTYALHMNLIAHGRAICKARSPACTHCGLRNACPFAADATVS